MASRAIPVDTKEVDTIMSALELAMQDYDWDKKDRKILELMVNRLNNTKKTIKHHSAKGKGRELQKKVCAGIAEITGIPYDQADDECLIHSREMGQSGVDVILRGKAKELFPYSIECKSTENTSITPFIQQAKQNCPPELDWLVVYKNKNLPQPIAMVDLSVFLRINKYMMEYKKG